LLAFRAKKRVFGQKSPGSIPQSSLMTQRRGLKSPEKRVSPQKGAQETGITGAHSEEEG